ncbi:MAG: glycosyltransferase family 4 protein [Patescibacteria group bacterium]|nr:glycosyltransferase family 4 protein [Patescibacteria group bacterium]
MKNADTRPRLLYFTSQVPELSSGSQVRSYHILHKLREIYRVTLYCVTDQKIDTKQFRSTVHADSHIYPIPNISLLRSIFYILSIRIPYIQRYRNSIPDNDLKNIPRADVCFFSELNGYFIAEQALKKQRAKMVFDAHNVEYVKFVGELSARGFWHRLASIVFTPVFRYIEQGVLRKMNRIYACSHEDARLIREMAPHVDVKVLPNGVACQYFTPRPKTAKPNTLLFIGNLEYSPNRDGLLYFLNEIFPRIQSAIPGIQMTITGRGNTSYLVSHLRNPAIRCTGFVPDVRDLIAAAEVCVCPLRFGSGTRLKVLEYMAMGKPVVSTTIGATGIKAVNGRDLLLADTPQAFAGAVVRLLREPDTARRLGMNARKCVERLYDWKYILGKLCEL